VLFACSFRLFHFCFYHFRELNIVYSNRRMREMKKLLVVLILAGILFVSSALADDLNPPSWRGQASTTFQMWEFGDDNPVAVPDVVDNQWGLPTATIVGSFPKTRWMTTDRERQGVWKTNEWIEIFIPNTDNTAPGTFKEIYLQMTFDAGPGFNALVVTIPDADPMTLEPISVEQIPGSDYSYGIWQIILEPNPTEEMIYIEPTYCELYIDEIVIDTRCVPEPTTIALLSLGTLVFLRKKRNA